MKNREQYFEDIKTYKLLANKSLGQNFLINASFAEKIVDLLEISVDDNILEIGAGLGSLSYFLAEKKAQACLIDIDERMLQFLSDNYNNESSIKIKRMNVLKEDLSSYSKIIGNLPYYITSKIIEHILLNAINAKKIVLMTQKEVYSKLLRTYKSPISLLLNHVSDISSPINISRNNFTPAPHVDSVVFSLTPNKNISNVNNKEVYKLMCQLFLFRRKTILNCLTSIVKDKQIASKILEKSNIENNLRPEQLSIDSYYDLTKQLKSSGFMFKI